MAEQLIAARARPVASHRCTRWLKQNLFNSPASVMVTVLILTMLAWALPAFWQWAVTDAQWHGQSSAECTGEGACWSFVVARMNQFIYGFYPDDQQWRVDFFFLQLALVIAWFIIPKTPRRGWVLGYGVLVMPFVSTVLLAGGVLGLEVVDTHQWGGLMLTLLLAIGGMLASLPLGILLALGRRSTMPVIRGLCTAFIELWRGVPLITVLFMASVMLPLFVPENIVFDKLLRAFIGIALFQSAYIAEVVRGGLQAIPKGQTEAFQSLGLSYWHGMVLVVLPQALRLVIPGIVNTFIALFKDTSLVLVIGLFDVLAIVQAGLNDPQWLGRAVEGYLFAGFVFWVFCFALSRYSQYLEKQQEVP